jgi:polar amino acid transport system substrate-binding protein
MARHPSPLGGSTRRRTTSAVVLLCVLAGACGTGASLPPEPSAVTAPVVVPAGAQVVHALVTSVGPSSGKPSGGTTVTVTGYGLRHASSVHFGRQRGKLLKVTSAGAGLSELTVVAPAHVVGSVNLGISGPDGPLALAANAFSFTTTPSPTATASCANPLASYAPPNPMPTAGHMPPGSWMAHILARGRLLAGVDQNNNLWGYLDPTTDQLSGFDIDMVRQVALAIFGGDPKTIDSKITWVPIDNPDRMRALTRQTNPVDIVAFTMTINCEREQSTLNGGPVDFSTEYFDAGQKILVAANSNINSLSDLAHKRVCATAGSTSMEHLFADAPMSSIKWAVVNQTDCLVMLQQGQVDAISTDNTILEGLAAQDPKNTKLVGDAFSDEPYGMAISKLHPEFTAFVNGVLAQVRANGTWATLYSNWLSPYNPGPIPSPPVAVYKAAP